MSEGDDKAMLWLGQERPFGLLWSVTWEYPWASAFVAGWPVMVASLKEMESSGRQFSGQRGPNGRILCWWCRKEVPPRRQHWCSAECVHAYRLENDWQYVRRHVFERDGGKCTACGVDISQAVAWWRRIAEHCDRGAYSRKEVFAAATAVGWPRQLYRDWWEADHVKARKEGGRDHLDNLRTLCVPCHKHRTKMQAGAWAKERRIKSESAPLFELAAETAPQRLKEGAASW